MRPFLNDSKNCCTCKKMNLLKYITLLYIRTILYSMYVLIGNIFVYRYLYIELELLSGAFNISHC